MPTTYPNQRVVQIHREPAKTNFLGIKNETWQAAARDLGAHACLLYLYLASNANDFKLALSPEAIRVAIGMPRSTYTDQFKKLIDKGYVVLRAGNVYDFYEVPQPKTDTQSTKNRTPNVLDFEDPPAAVKDLTADFLGCSPENIEINKYKKPTTTGDKYRCDETSKNTAAVPKEEEKRTPTYSKEWSF